jgi:hypothetical protein
MWRRIFFLSLWFADRFTFDDRASSSGINPRLLVLRVNRRAEHKKPNHNCWDNFQRI